MNYLRGAVNAISAPYQYYKDLPPINPSTLTGAIDVIVVQRPTASGGTELVCTPFHVRFGKWQVLRPGEKKVDVSVNGQRIPFNMKIGEAGEAFFIFETDDDVPDDLITSPLLQPTDEGGTTEPEVKSGEPEFLDLNAPPSPPDDAAQIETVLEPPTPSTPRVETGPFGLQLPSGGLSLPSPPPTPLPRSEQELNERADAALRQVGKDLHLPDVEYREGVALDTEGYHYHDRERSDRTVRSADTNLFEFPHASSSRLPESDEESDYDEEDTDTLSRSATWLRATSEPPPDTEEPSGSSFPSSSTSHSQLPTSLKLAPVQEYSWEWGAFPQPSPMKASFGKGGRIEGPSDIPAGPRTHTWGKSIGGRHRMKLPSIPQDDEDRHGRSRSVPPVSGDRRELPRRMVAADAEFSYHFDPGVISEGEEGEYGRGGTLGFSRSDPTLFRITLDNKKTTFELSLVNSEDQSGGEHEDHRGRRARDGSLGGQTGVPVLAGLDEFEVARRFDEGKIDFERFLEDETIVTDQRLVIRWAGEQYITQDDLSPLTRALVMWRTAHLRQPKVAGDVSPRPSSPVSDEDDANEEEAPKSAPAVATEKLSGAKPPTSSSWVQWWSRRSQEKAERPEMKAMASDPTNNGSRPHQRPHILKEIPPAESAPALPSTPVQTPRADVAPPRPSTPTQKSTDAAIKHKYIKTLRLSSDQLKSLNLKPGANTITFALSTTGFVACAARIFVWDSTDVVLISDIDGTITKSDGLGHVFAMLGRDWTHLGVAKLYTDICRNGYKIMYLTSRAIGQADATRHYLKGIKQNDYQLPEGPVIMSPDRLMASLHREVIMRKPELFKMACLRDIQRIFGEASRNPFYAGFGNRITDALSYRSVNVPSSRIFTIDSSGEVKLELLELAGYKSSYIHMTDLVDQIFPPIHRKWMPEYTDLTYWKTPVRDFPLPPDFSPPSPTLSARSDTSNQSTLARIRNFSLVSGRQSSISISKSPERSMDLQKMSSFERLSSTLGFSGNNGRRSASPESQSSSSLTFAESDDEDEGFELDVDGKRVRRERRRSMTSMPGSLDDDMGLDDDDDDQGGHYSDDQHQLSDDEEAAEEAFDEDLLAAGEMKNVPFL